MISLLQTANAYMSYWKNHEKLYGNRKI